MAKTTRVVLTCDLHGDGTDAVTTISIGDGTARYDLDVCQLHLDELTGTCPPCAPRTPEPLDSDIEATAGQEIDQDP